jgi:hypothetical protein
VFLWRTVETAKEERMSIIMTLRVNGDGNALERLAGEQPELLQAIAKRGKAAGAIAHRFYGSDDEIIVIDEWPDAQSFLQFYEREQGEIGPIMAQVATGEPVVTFWRKLETHDEIGWD